MTQILNVQIPANEAMKLIRGIKESNSMTQVGASFYYEFVDFWGNPHRMKQDWIVKDINNYEIVSDVTINSISPITYPYLEGDEVMILATGEIGILEFAWRKFMLVKLADGTKKEVHRSEICKIA